MVLGLVLLICGAYIMANPVGYQTTEKVDERSYEIDIDHSAVTVMDSELYESGRVLNNSDVYFWKFHPNLSLIPSVESDIDTQTNSISAQVEYTAKTGDKLVWSKKESVTRVSYIEREGSGYNVDMKELEDKLVSINENLPSNTSLSVSIHFTETVSSDKDDSVRVNGQATIVSGGSDEIYSVQTTTQEKVRTDQVTKKVRYANPIIELGGYSLDKYSGILILLGFLSFLSGVYGYVESEDLDPYEFRLYEYHREKYDDWISTGSSGLSVHKNTIEMDTLQDLGEVAIDNKNRIIHDVDSNKYCVFTESKTYIFHPPAKEKNHTDSVEIMELADPEDKVEEDTEETKNAPVDSENGNKNVVDDDLEPAVERIEESSDAENNESTDNEGSEELTSEELFGDNSDIDEDKEEFGQDEEVDSTDDTVEKPKNIDDGEDGSDSEDTEETRESEPDELHDPLEKDKSILEKIKQYLSQL